MTTDTAEVAAPDAGTAGPADVKRGTGRGRAGRGFRLAATLLVCGTTFAAAGWLTSWRSPIPVREIVVEGGDESSLSGIREAAGIAIGTPIADVDTDSVAARVGSLSGIEKVELELARPWTVVIRVLERHPFAVAAQGNGFLVLDDSGQEIRASAAQPRRLPLVAASREQWQSVLSVLAALPDEIRARVQEAKIESDGNVALRLRQGGAVVVWGDARDSARKADVLKALLPLRAKTYNVSVPDRPAVTGNIKLPKENRDDGSAASGD